MAVYNEMLVGRFNRAIQKLVGVKGGPPVRQISSELVASFSFPIGREFRYLEGWATMGASITAGNVAANFSAAQIRNPLGSNVVGVIEKIAFSLGAAGACQVGYKGGGTVADLAGGALTTIPNLDNRFTPGVATPRGSVLQVSSQNSIASVPTGDIIIQYNAPATTTDVMLTDSQEMVLVPNSAIWVSAGTANVAITVNFLWRERFLEDSERS